MRLRKLFLRTVTAATLSLRASSGAAALPSDCSELGPALTDHSCFHATFGPYETVTAGAGVPSSEAAPDVDRVHTYYDVRLPSASGENTVSYRIAAADRAGEWAIFHDPLIPLRVLDEAGRALVPTLDADVGRCAFLPRATVFSLRDERYRLVLGPAASTRALLVIENVTDFITRNGRDRDGDGYGDPNDVIVTMCTPDPGYVADATDCDDTDPEKHPGAAERCDALDQNCNGVPDDVGLPCSAGAGACKSTGTLSCRALDGAATCSASTIAPEAETCDGTDEDCDGLRDDEERGLCSSADAPACVLVVGRWECGCRNDADCGGFASGRICEDEKRVCVSGCVDAGGRNGCPPGFRCTSGDVNSPGECEPAPCTTPNCIDAGPPEPESEPDAGPSRGEPPPDEPRRVEGGCGCRTAGGARSSRLVGVFAAALLVIAQLRRRRCAVVKAIVALGLGASGCGGQFVQEGNEEPTRSQLDGGDPPSACTPRLGPRLVAHACSHGSKGPFVDVVAAEHPGEPLPDVSLVHHVYLVSAAGSSRTGYVSFVPGRAGQHAVFSSAGDVTMTRQGSELALEPRAPVDGCVHFARSSVSDMKPGMEYVLSMELGDEPIALFLEHLGTFGPAAWSKCD